MPPLCIASCRLDVLTSAPGLLGLVVPEAMQPRSRSIENNNDVKKQNKAELESEPDVDSSSEIGDKDKISTKSKNQNKMSSKSQKKEGDRLQISFFGTRGLAEGTDMKIQFLTSILSFQRQFHACVDWGTNTVFDGELLGNKAVFGTLTEGNDDTVDSSVTESDNSIVRMEDISGSIRIPTLNESQQRACDSFLSGRGVKISIVQG